MASGGYDFKCSECGAEYQDKWEAVNCKQTTECREKRGLVPCNSFFCRAKLNVEYDPENPYEIWEAYVHWRDHMYLNGCSHGR